jgi:hypothetical protein
MNIWWMTYQPHNIMLTCDLFGYKGPPLGAVTFPVRVPWARI